MVHWYSLTREIRLMILKLLLRQKHGLASYATVCKEWQTVIEKRIFRRLKLRASCLDDFERMVRRQRSLVKHIWLNIELRTYTCRSCQDLESCSWASSNNRIIRQAISKLFSILNSWDLVGDGLSLELSAQSPSDSEHWFKTSYFGVDCEDRKGIVGSRAHGQKVTATFHDPKHGWVDGRQLAVPDGHALLRLFEIIDLRFEKDLPEVHAVTKLVLRRQCRRQFVPRTLWLLLDKLPQLKHLVYEPWRVLDRTVQKLHYDIDYGTMIEAHLPKGLKRISLFEDFNEDHVTLVEQTTCLQPDYVRQAQPAVGAALAYRSLDVEQLYVSYMVDAQHFFQARQPLWTWANLETLVLTSPLLTPATYYKNISNLLEGAAEAALNMPRLQTMALWNGGRRKACGFIFRKGPNNPSITVRSTWDMKLQHRTIHIWKRVASPNELRIEKEMLRSDIIKSHGDAICHLGLPHGVIDPVSLRQIHQEGISPGIP
ncbi:hypothetical protein ABOM_002608 [Aspergillus bombycis]|uniref:DUF6546 domain-containing protein n=1 Tax=Aspergillus bombycis TaxID=109264 RepID=A0A1F8A6V8_9EURO|nr:hypothetical protein ABOM_002608 [Aspergillus bombycis]OGM47451.1 hypothetical protein ABOM_002608 [Aspergillus bombycis]